MNAREITERDFIFDGPLGCQGAKIERLDPNRFRLTPGHAPAHPEWANMVNFTIAQGAKGNPLRIHVYFHGGDVMRFNDYSYSWSHDGENWRPLHWERFEKEGAKGDALIFAPFEEDTVYVGHQVPMSYEKMTALYAGYSGHDDARVVEIGKSLEGRPMLRLEIAAPGDTPPDKRRAHYFANQHPGEHNAQWRMAGMIEWLLSDDPDAQAFRQTHTAHFLMMMSPDAPSHGWYRVNGQGVDMNRSYRAAGADAAEQAHEAYVAQSDLEALAAAAPLRSVWSFHTWGGVVETLVQPGAATESDYGSWAILRDEMLRADPNGRLKPLKEMQPASYAGSWARDPHDQFDVSAFLCEGAGNVYLKEDCLDAGRALMTALARYCLGTRL